MRKHPKPPTEKQVDKIWGAYSKALDNGQIGRTLQHPEGWYARFGAVSNRYREPFMEEIPNVGRELYPSTYQRFVINDQRSLDRHIKLPNMQKLQEISLVSSDLPAYLNMHFDRSALDKGISLYVVSKGSLRIKRRDIEPVLDKMVNSGKYIRLDCQLINWEELIYINVSYNEDYLMYVYIKGQDKEVITELMKNLVNLNDNTRSLSFKWYWNEAGENEYIVSEIDEIIHSSLYPFINDFDTYAERFFTSKANILILQGPPGTGKTTFLKHLIEKSGKTAYLSYDARILSRDNAFAEFITDDSAETFIIEDADLLLESRANGNDMVAKFLNIGDGLVNMKRKKLIFSTNLKNLSDVDEALTRPGRCFATEQFRSLTLEESRKVVTEYNIDFEPESGTYSLAELFNKGVKTASRKVSSLGFGFTGAI